MNILIICQYYYPEQFLINEIAPELVKRGHKVTVLTGLPNYPEGKILRDYRYNRRNNEIINGAHVIRCSEIGRHKGKLFLLLNYISYPFFACRKVKRLDKTFDIVFCYQLSPILMVLPAIKYKRKFDIPIYLYCLDIWPESALAHVKNEHSILYKKIASISKSIYKKCDLISVTSEPFIEYMQLVNDISVDSLAYIPQHADNHFLNSDLTAQDNEIADFMFAGNLGAGQTLDVIINAANLLKDRCDFKVHFVGDGSQMPILQSLTKEKGLENKIVFHGRHSISEMDKYYKMADVLLITLRGNNFVGNTMPGKLQIYMTTGKPIFGAINGAAQQVIKKANCGACVNSGDHVGLAELMLDYIQNPHKYEKCGYNAKEYFRRSFTKEIFIDRIENGMLQLVQK